MGGSASLIPRDTLGEYQVPGGGCSGGHGRAEAEGARGPRMGALGQALAPVPALSRALPAGADVPEQAGDLAVSTAGRNTLSEAGWRREPGAAGPQALPRGTESSGPAPGLQFRRRAHLSREVPVALPDSRE